MSHVLKLSFQDVQRLVRCFAGFAHGTRLEILTQLSRTGGELPAWDFAFKQVRTVSEVNQHLRRLCESGLVVSRQEGRRRMYRLAAPWVVQMLRVARQALRSKALGGTP